MSEPLRMSHERVEAATNSGGRDPSPPTGGPIRKADEGGYGHFLVERICPALQVERPDLKFDKPYAVEVHLEPKVNPLCGGKGYSVTSDFGWEEDGSRFKLYPVHPTISSNNLTISPQKTHVCEHMGKIIE